MKFRRIRCFALSFLLLPLLVLGAYAGTITLGTAGNYAVLAGSAVDIYGPATLSGDLGLWPAASSYITGLTSVTFASGTVDNTDAMTAQGDLTTAYTTAAGLSVPPTNTLTTISGATTLIPGVYSISSSAALTGTLTLKGGPGALFVFQSGAFTTGSGASELTVLFFNTTTDSYGYDPNIFWQTTSSMTLGTYTAFEGNILALTSITLDPYSTITCGSALARNGAVTLSGYNTISGCGSETTTVPEPGTLSLLGSGLAILVGAARRRMRI